MENTPNTPTLIVDEVAEGQKITLRKLAVAAQEKAVAAVESYLELCRFIRREQILPKVITATLRECGFVDSRISEIKRVALCSEEVFAQYESKAIGFKLALQKSREAKKNGQKKPEPQAEEERYVNALLTVFAAFVPAAGKVPKWANASFEVQGCKVNVRVSRKA